MTDQTLLTTAQAAEATGIPAGTIRSWLSRHSQVFQLGVHVVKDEAGRNLWTQAGIELLRRRNGAAEIEASSATTGDAFFDASSDAIANQFLDLAADVRARYILQQLPMRTLNRMRELIHSSPEVQESLQATVHQLTHYQIQTRGLLNAAAETAE